MKKIMKYWRIILEVLAISIIITLGILLYLSKMDNVYYRDMTSEQSKIISEKLTELNKLDKVNTQSKEMVDTLQGILATADELISVMDSLQYNTGISLSYLSQGDYQGAILYYGKAQTYHQKSQELYNEYQSLTEDFINRYYKYNNELQIN